jgi:hypothetical protein
LEVLVIALGLIMVRTFPEPTPMALYVPNLDSTNPNLLNNLSLADGRERSWPPARPPATRQG